ncbi:SNF2 family N-terminal domain-containing protein [Lipomyces chichibuensis]|uniref:SNF2 family N-terminal domain-containing protein n=1 Tax=Lipomyces chichibuensis TaxID=1546026 RepID=UPI003342FD76
MAPSRVTRSAMSGAGTSPPNGVNKAGKGASDASSKCSGDQVTVSGRVLRATPARTPATANTQKRLSTSPFKNRNTATKASPESEKPRRPVGRPPKKYGLQTSTSANSREEYSVEPSPKRLRSLRGKSAANSENDGYDYAEDGNAELHGEIKEEDQLEPVRRIKIKYSVPKPMVAQPAHIPAPPAFNSLDLYLDSFRILENDDVTEEIFSRRAKEEAKLRQSIDEAIAEGRLNVDNDSSSQGMTASSLKRPFEPPRARSHREHFLSHAIYLSKLAADVRKSHLSRAKKIASMMQLHFKRLSGADEKERRLAEKLLRQLAKRTAMEVKRKWRLAEKVVRQKITQRQQEQQRLVGKLQLNSILDHSTQLLEARRGQLRELSAKNEFDNDDKSIFDESESDIILDSELDSTSDEDSDSEFMGRTESQSDGGDEYNKDTKELDEPKGILEIRPSLGLADLYSADELQQTSPAGIGVEIPDVNPHGNANVGNRPKMVESSDSHDRASSVSVSVTSESRATPCTPSGAARTTIPFLLRGKLREYQHSGLDWLAGLYNSGTNGILADEMGLGKTIQTISLLSYLACEKEIWGPHLIVVPTSVMLNWEMEFKRFAPGFRILTYYGNPAQRKEKRRGWNNDDSWDVCITSYQLVIHDQNAFRRKQWQYMILDEAHNIKNFRSQRWQALLNFKAKRRLLLTGTPLQNNLIELWSLLYFLMPSSKDASSVMANGFASLSDFQDWFSHPVDKLIEGNYSKEDDEARNTISKLHKVLRPYLLRRLKADVEKQMPAKYEHIVYCKLSKRQRYLYDDFMSRAQTKETLASGNFLSIINCLMQLRKVCNHPDLFEVRPIVTSFAMERSAIASYEIKELLIRKRLLAETSENEVNLEFLNLVPAKNEQMSTVEASSSRLLCANCHIQRDWNTLMSSIDAEFSTDYTSINGYRKAALYHRKIANAEHLRQQLYTNHYRCTRSPLYGRNVIEACQINVPQEKREPWLRRYPCDKLVLSVCDRAELMKDSIEHYAFVTPNVVALDLRRLVFPSVSTSIFSAIRQKYENPMHQAQVKLSIAFPDKRLLQYDCGKLQRLAVLLRDLNAGGHRALIFTQMTRVLDVLEQFLNIHGCRYLRLDGATKIEQRQIMTERFNSDPKITVFILSTRSGGLGINLTGADTVIFYDSDWNPSMDKQCQDRCHRIGQTRDVHIYRFVSEYTIESNILRKANQKRMLDDIVIQGGDFTTDYFTKLSLSDMLGTESDEKSTASLDVQVRGLKGGLEKALAQAEDEDDAIAARVAMKETRVDADDFYEQDVGTGADDDIADSTPVPKGSTVGSSAATPSRMLTDADGEDKSIEIRENRSDREHHENEDDDEEEDEGIGTVDDYMIRFIEMGYYWD